MRLDDAIFNQVLADLSIKNEAQWNVTYTDHMICLSKYESDIYIQLCMRASLIDNSKMPDLVTLDYASKNDSEPHSARLSLIQKAKVWYRFKKMIWGNK